MTQFEIIYQKLIEEFPGLIFFRSDHKTVSEQALRMPTIKSTLAPLELMFLKSVSTNGLFGANLRVHMEINELNQIKLADKVGSSKQQVNNWIKGYAAPTVRTAGKIAAVLNCSTDDLIN